MRITYDREVDALYILFKETTVTTEHVAEGIAVDYDADGKLAGIEILDASKRLGDSAARSLFPVTPVLETRFRWEIQHLDGASE
jgi:YD repeat-containing protein